MCVVESEPDEGVSLRFLRPTKPSALKVLAVDDNLRGEVTLGVSFL